MRLILLFAACSLQLGAQAPAIRALLIENSTYSHLPARPWAKADVDAVRDALNATGKASISIVRDATFDALETALQDQFIPSIRENDVVIVYFSGYALQSGGPNFLLGTDFDPKSQGELRDRAYQLDRLRGLQPKKPGLVILALDGAYDDPALQGVAGYSQGLAASRQTPNFVVLYSSAQDRPALRPEQGPSVFGRAFAEALRAPGLSVLDIATRIVADVDSHTASRQHPYSNADYAGAFRFVPPRPVEVVPPPKPIVQVQIVREGPSRRQHHDDREYYVLIPAGKFLMGCVPDSECEQDEKPQHPVEITKPFWLGENEVEVDAYQHYVDLTKGKMPRAPNGRDWKVGDKPMVMVSWDDSQKYCLWLGGRLPTEAEWEYAARAGTANQVYPMADFKKARDVANFIGKSGNDTYDNEAPVKRFDKNPFGIHDLSGNVWEWVSDFFSVGYYQTSPPVDPPGAAQGKEHVMRGGSYYSDPAKHLRLSYREGSSGAKNNVGFRCALPDTPEIQGKLK